LQFCKKYDICNLSQGALTGAFGKIFLVERIGKKTVCHCLAKTGQCCDNIKNPNEGIDLRRFTMDPRTRFYNQVDIFLEKFKNYHDWSIGKDKKNDIIIIIPPEWIVHSQYNGVSFQFALNTRGELVFSIGVEKPISLESRASFKVKLRQIMLDKGLFETVFSGFLINIKRRGKFVKKATPLLSDVSNIMLSYIERSIVLVPDVKELIDEFERDGKLIDINMETKQLSKTSQNKQIVSFDDEIDFDDGESDYEMEYNIDRKFLTQKTEYSIEYLYKLYIRGRLDLQPDFQRRYVWDIIKASSLIESLFLDVPIPAIYLAEDESGIMTVIDGQQRLASIFSFLSGVFPDGKKLTLKGLKVLRDLNKHQFKDIDMSYQDKFDAVAISTIVIKKESDPELKFDIFERLNTGSVKLNDQELRNCIFRGPYLNLLKKLSADKEFRYIMGLKKADKRMKDVEYVLRFAAFYHQTYLKYSKSQNMKNYLNLEMKNNQNIKDEEMDDLETTFRKAVQINKSLFGNRSFRRIKPGDQENHNLSWKNTTVVNGALYDLMMVSFLNYDKNMIYRNLDAIREAFIHLVTEHEEFIDCIEKWTNSFSQIKKRFEIFNETISAIFKMDTKQERCFSFDFKEKLFKLNNNCAICNQTIFMVEDAAVDHIEQYWLGGKTIPENGRLVHRYCNAARRRKEGSGDSEVGETANTGNL